MVSHTLYGKIATYWIVSLLEKDVPEIRVPLAIKACQNKIGPTLLKIFRMTASQLKSPMTGWRLSILVWSYCSNDQTEVRLWERWYLLSGTVGNNVFSGKDDIPLELNLVILHAHCKYSTTFFFCGIFFSRNCAISSKTQKKQKGMWY